MSIHNGAYLFENDIARSLATISASLPRSRTTSTRCISDDKCNQLIIDCGVLNEGAVISQGRLKLSDRKEMFVADLFFFASPTMLKLTRDLKQLSFAVKKFVVPVLSCLPGFELDHERSGASGCTGNSALPSI